MSRKDTLIIAVLVNSGLLALLFILAINGDDDQTIDSLEITKPFIQEKVDNKNANSSSYDIALLSPEGNTTPETDEMDNLFKDLSHDDSLNPVEIEELAVVETVKKQQSPPNLKKGDFVEVTVKRGDALEKIAKSNGTSVEAIRQANGLTSNKLSIGQVLKVPLSKETNSLSKEVVSSSNIKKTENATKPALDSSSTDVVYYTIKGGDNPWKVAKQHNVNVDELLKLNGLNEERAKNLKPGDKIRVK